eukprot:10627793-Heterocapsa_arctica.AAC.1
MLRHTGSGWSYKSGRERITDEAGWTTVGSISEVAKSLEGKYGLAPKVINVNYMHRIVLDDDKGGFQLGVLVAEPDIPDPSRKLRVFKIYAMRA